MIYCNTRNLTLHKTGVQRYTEEILRRFPEDSWENISPPNRISRGFTGHFWEQLYLGTQISKNDVLWSPANTGPVFLKRHVVTIHDVVPFDHPEWLNKYFAAWYRAIQPTLVRNAAYVITISNFSKERIMYHLNVPEKKIKVIYNGVDDTFFNTNNNSFERIEHIVPGKNFILSLGSLEPRKNLKRLLKGWSQVEGKLPPDFYLVVVGKKGSSLIFDNNDISENVNKVSFTGHVPDELLPALYNNAKAFFYLSEYEGFGLPPLEAMAVGTPVVTSNCTAIPEVVGDCAKLIDPFSIDEISSSVVSSFEGNLVSTSNIKKGVERAKSFNWEKSSKLTWDILQSV